MFPLEFVEIQVVFAHRMAELSGIPYHEMLLANTDLPDMLGLGVGWDLHPDNSNPVWQQFVSELHEEGTGISKAYSFYTQLHAQGLIPDNDENRLWFGCFSYDYDSEIKAMQIHIAARDETGSPPLSLRRKEARLAELRAMIAYVYLEHPEAQRVVGGSWMMFREGYSRILPPKQIAAAWPAELKLGRLDRPRGFLTGLGLWGQFLRHGDRINDEVASLFLDRLARLEDVKDFGACFPYQYIRTDVPISYFYEFCGII